MAIEFSKDDFGKTYKLFLAEVYRGLDIMYHSGNKYFYIEGYSICLTSLKAARNVIDSHLRNKSNG